jgi:hypothetical protein
LPAYGEDVGAALDRCDPLDVWSARGFPIVASRGNSAGLLGAPSARVWKTAGCGPDCGPTGLRQSPLGDVLEAGAAGKAEPGLADIARSGNFCGAGTGGATLAKGKRAGSVRAGLADGVAGGVVVGVARTAVAEASAR